MRRKLHLTVGKVLTTWGPTITLAWNCG